MKQKIQIHRIATEDMTYVLERKNKSLIHWKHPYIPKGIEENGWCFYHLYATVSQEVEPIKDGDWCYNHKLPGRKLYQMGEGIPDKASRKIIATTDKKLIIGSITKTENATIGKYAPIPKFEQSFIKQYCDKDSIDEALVKYQVIISSKEPWKKLAKPKLNSGNTVTIYPLEEKMYSGKEVEALIRLFSDYADSCVDHEGINNACCSIGDSSWDEDNWIKLNL